MGSCCSAIYIVGGVLDFTNDLPIVNLAAGGCTNGSLTEEEEGCFPVSVFSTRPADTVPS